MAGKLFQKMKSLKVFYAFNIFEGFFSLSAVLIECILKRIASVVEMLLSQISMKVISFLHNELFKFD